MPIKKIAFLVTRGDSIGGAQIHVRDLSRALKNQGIEVLVLTGSAGDLTAQLEESGINWRLVKGLIRSINPFQDLAAIWETAGILKAFSPDLISTHTAKSGLVGRWAGFLAGIPSLFTAHGWQFADGIGGFQKSLVLLTEKLTAPLCPRIITVSQYDYELAVRYKIATGDKLRLVHNGMPDRPAPVRVSSSGQDNQVPKLIMVARFQEQKDHQTLLLALAALKDKPWNLELVGDGPLLEQSQKLAQTLGISDRVLFSGQKMDVPERLDKADLYLLITHWEGFPRSILEAMRASLPVVATDVGGVREAVLDGVTGFLVKENDVPALTARLNTLLDNPVKMREWGRAGRSRFEENFTFAAMMQKTMTVYEEILVSTQKKRTIN